MNAITESPPRVAAGTDRPLDAGCAMVATPIGELLLAADGDCLTELQLDPAPAPRGKLQSNGAQPPVLREAAAQLQAYFAGKLRRFDLPLAPRGTLFRQRVWKALCDIPYGETISYAELARRVGSPRGYRAVGQANGANPIAIIVPCHRVIAADDTLGGYGGGLPRKRWLLELEGKL
jgi:methylated-DNA-[protein]-cysteine S-methyltransferase